MVIGPESGRQEEEPTMRDKLAPGTPSRWIVLAFAVLGWSAFVTWLVERLAG